MDNKYDNNIRLIIATDIVGGFGYQGEIPWHYKEDFTFFKSITMGHKCVMGRVTYEEINTKMGDRGRDNVLPGRECYVISKTLTSLPNATVIQSLNQMPDRDFFVIGGSTLYNETLTYAKYVYHTSINNTFTCDVHFDLQYMRNVYTPIETFTSTIPELSFTLYERL